jgi:hypothetical protein
MSFEFPIGIQNNAHNNKMMSDLLKVFTVTVVKELVSSNLYKNKGPFFTKRWATTTAITLFGFMVYYLIVSKVIKFNLTEEPNNN